MLKMFFGKVITIHWFCFLLCFKNVKLEEMFPLNLCSRLFDPNEWCLKNGLFSGGLNPRPLSHESSALTTRPRTYLLSICLICLLFFKSYEKYINIDLDYWDSDSQKQRRKFPKIGTFLYLSPNLDFKNGFKPAYLIYMFYILENNNN